MSNTITRHLAVRGRVQGVGYRNYIEYKANQLGVKGAGEAGAVALFPALGNAIMDALAPLGVQNFDGPATPGRIWQAMRPRWAESSAANRRFTWRLPAMMRVAPSFNEFLPERRDGAASG